MKNNKNVLIIAGVVALLVGAFFAGSVGNSSNNTNPAPEPTNTWTPDTPDVPSYSDEELYLDAVNGTGNSYILSTSDSELLDYGWTICGLFDDGYGIADIVEVVVENAVTEEEAGAWGSITGAAIVYLCPEYSYLIDDIDSGSY